MKTPKTAKYIALILLLVSPVLTASALSKMTFAPAVPCGGGHQLGLKGDVNGDCHRNLLDVVQLIKIVVGPPSDMVPLTADVDCNHIVDALDVVILIDFLFRQTPEPAACTQ